MEENESLTIHNSLLVIACDGKLKRIWCPFPVKVIRSVEVLHEGETHMVISVRMGEVKLLYVIGNHAYTHSFFIILANKP